MKRLFLLATALCAMSAPAHAEIINLNFNLIATNFVDTRPRSSETPPIAIVNGTFSLTFDNASDIQATSNGLNVTGLNLIGAPLFAYSKRFDLVSIGTKPGPAIYTLTIPGDTFGFFVGNASRTNYDVSGFDYSKNPARGFFSSSDVTITRLNSAVPEPASWAMMIGGFGFVGGALRHRKRRERALSAA